jgi:UDP-glucose 4-epimerase
MAGAVENGQMRLLVTGGAGFIGANLVPRLEAAGHFVRVLDSQVMGKREHLGGFQGEFLNGDIRDEATLGAALEDIEAVIHLAADTRVIESIADPALNFEVNAVGSFRLLEAMRARGIKRFINASTGGAIIGEVEPPVHEEMVPRPVSPYGATKLAVEGLCSAYAGSFGFTAISLRFANVYGPRSFHKGSVVAAFYKQILLGQPLVIYGDGEQTRDFVYVEDLCAGIVNALSVGQSGVYQLGSGVPLSVNGLIAAMRDVVAPYAIAVDYRPARQGEIARTWCQIDHARAQLGFDPATPLAQGLAATWQWFLDSQI